MPQKNASSGDNRVWNIQIAVVVGVCLVPAKQLLREMIHVKRFPRAVVELEVEPKLEVTPWGMETLELESDGVEPLCVENRKLLLMNDGTLSCYYLILYFTVVIQRCTFTYETKIN